MPILKVPSVPAAASPSWSVADKTLGIVPASYPLPLSPTLPIVCTSPAIVHSAGQRSADLRWHPRSYLEICVGRTTSIRPRGFLVREYVVSCWIVNYSVQVQGLGGAVLTLQRLVTVSGAPMWGVKQLCTCWCGQPCHGGGTRRNWFKANKL